MKKIIIALVALLCLVAAFFAYNWLRDNKMPNFYGRAEFNVNPSDTPDDVIETLRKSVKILSEKRLRKVFAQKEVANYIKPGHYTVNSTCTSVYVARMLNNGWQTPVSVTLSGSLRTREELARKISRQLRIDSVSVMRAFEDTALMAAYGATPENVFPAFFPATYSMYWTASLTDLLDRCRKASDAFWTADNKATAARLGLTPREAVVLASIVKGESNHKEEYSRIAGVYLNRLKRGMLLQADPTVAYCYDYVLKRVLYRHLEFDSPYNTYKYAGLPPGPINVPEKEYIEAVLNPDFGGGNLYFCASPALDGTHVFARTLEQHNRNAHAFQKAVN
ncbi:MAG: endolytic transglycosylase MltG [Bacteroidales bacterium]|nr:endolytic transglycosylase MltG [Bacteroidales bacterium]